MTQPSLSLFLQKLEVELKTPLFERINKKLYPTYAGKRYLEYAEHILQMNQSLRRELSDLAEANCGWLSIASTPTRARYVLPELLADFHRKYPNFKIEVMEEPPDRVSHLLEEHVVDFAIFTMPELDDRFRYHVLCQEEIVLCAARDCGLTQFSRKREGFFYPWLDLRLLKDEMFLLVSDKWRTGRTALRFFEETGLRPKSISFSIVETAAAAAAEGLGLCFCPDIMIRHGLFRHPLDYFSVGENPNHVCFVLAHRKEFPMTPPLEDFVTMAKAILGNNDMRFSR